MGNRIRMTPHQRADAIMHAAMELAVELGYTAITREKVAERARVSPALVSYHAGTVGEIHFAIVSRAIQERNPQIVTHALLNNHPLVQGDRIDEELRGATLEYMRERLQHYPEVEGDPHATS